MGRTANILTSRRESVDKEIAQLQEEIHEIDIALAAIAKDRLSAKSTTKSKANISIPEQIIHTLESADDGVETFKIKTSIDMAFGKVNLPTLRSTLSRMKAKKAIKQEDGKWFPVTKNETPSEYQSGSASSGRNLTLGAHV